MKEDNTNKIFSYLHRTGKTIFIAIILLIVSVLLFTLFISPINIGTYRTYRFGLFFAAIIFLIFGISLIITEPANRKKVHAMLNQYDKSLLICDFDGAHSFFNDNLRVGSTYIYSQGTEKIIPILDIRKISICRNSDSTLCVCASTAYDCVDKLHIFEEEKYDDVVSETQILTNELVVVNNVIEFQQI